MSEEEKKEMPGEEVTGHDSQEYNKRIVFEEEMTKKDVKIAELDSVNNELQTKLAKIGAELKRIIGLL